MPGLGIGLGVGAGPNGLGVGRAGGAGGSAFSRTVLGLLDAEDFPGANGADPVGWTEHTNTLWAVNGANVLEFRSGAQPPTPGITADAVTAGKMLVQATVKVLGGTNAWPVICARADKGGTQDCIYWAAKISSGSGWRLARVLAGGHFTLQDAVSGGFTGDTFYTGQLYVADSIQEAWGSSNAADATASATNTDLNGKNVHSYGFAKPLGTNQTAHDGVNGPLVFRDKNIIVTGLGPGEKVKVLNAAEAVVAEAIESGGTATIDCSRFGSATEIVPFNSANIDFAGWPHIIQTDSLDVELSRFSPDTTTEQGVCPGDEYAL